MNNLSDSSAIDCLQIKLWLHTICQQEQQAKHNKVAAKILTMLKQIPTSIKFLNPTLEVREDTVKLEKIILDLRTYICANGHCKLKHIRSHKRMSDYNWRKENSISTERYKSNIKTIAYDIIHNRRCGDNTITSKINLITFVKAKINSQNTKTNIKKKKYEPIEKVFDRIDKKAEKNNIKTQMRPPKEAPGKPILENNSYRMTYGDLNYLGNNKALFYFDRGRGVKQTFTNSCYALKQQPSHKDLIVIDGIVFTSPCKCNSFKQHKEMFPHYRVTCAVGLTCPAKLTSWEKISYARNKHAPTEPFTTARTMLVRHW